MRRRHFLNVAGGTMAASMFAPTLMASNKERPNILIIIGDDCTYSDLPLYGGRNVSTPKIDTLAKEGVTFNNAYLCMAMCQPCRSELFTGLYPMRNGCCWNHSACYPQTRSIVHRFRDLGYRVGISGKVHVKPEPVFLFETVPGVYGGAVGKRTRLEPGGLRRFMTRDDSQPFCLVAGLVVPHVPWTVGDPGHFDPDTLALPPYLADTPQTRKDYAKYLAEIEILDQQVGIILKTLDEAGKAENTIVVFTSEQGAQFPGCKWTNWEQGVHTGLVIRWPQHIQAGQRTDAMVQYADVLPTLLDAAGVDFGTEAFDGSSFLHVLRGERDEHREYAYFMHNNVPEGPPYPIRSIRDQQFHYIHNLTPDETYIERHLFGVVEHNPYWVTWTYAAADDPHTYEMVHRYVNRPEEELYFTPDDPNELHNIADDPQHSGIKEKLKNELQRWMTAQGDPGTPLDTWDRLRASRQQAQQGKSR